MQNGVCGEGVTAIRPSLVRILYVGQLRPGGTCLDRMHALQRLGHELIGVNQDAFESPVRLLRSLQWRLHPRWMLQEFNREIVRAAENVSGVDIVWIDKGIWVFPETIESLKRQLQALVVHFTPDPQILFHRSRHFLDSIPLYDHVITTKSFETRLYAEANAKHVIRAQQSYCPVRYMHAAGTGSSNEAVGFIGHYEKSYGRTISAVAQQVPVGVWGNGWPRASRLGRVPRDVIRGRGLWGADYVATLASFKIGLGLLSKYIPEQHTTRSFEIPAAGSLLLAERTDEHLEYFHEGEEAEFFASVDELVDKARFYLANDTARLRIAQQGRLRCAASGYDTDTVMKRIIALIA